MSVPTCQAQTLTNSILILDRVECLPWIVLPGCQRGYLQDEGLAPCADSRVAASLGSSQGNHWGLAAIVLMLWD